MSVNFNSLVSCRAKRGGPIGKQGGWKKTTSGIAHLNRDQTRKTVILAFRVLFGNALFAFQAAPFWGNAERRRGWHQGFFHFKPRFQRPNQRRGAGGGLFENFPFKKTAARLEFRLRVSLNPWRGNRPECSLAAAVRLEGAVLPKKIPRAKTNCNLPP